MPVCLEFEDFLQFVTLQVISSKTTTIIIIITINSPQFKVKKGRV